MDGDKARRMAHWFSTRGELEGMLRLSLVLQLRVPQGSGRKKSRNQVVNNETFAMSQNEVAISLFCPGANRAVSTILQKLLYLCTLEVKATMK